MTRTIELFRSALGLVKERCGHVAAQPERTILLVTILVMSVVSAVTGFVLAQYYSIDVLSSLIFEPHDCWLDWGMNVGRHCFSDYTMPVTLGLRANPWEPYPAYSDPSHAPFRNNYPPAAMIPHLAFGLLGKWLHAPRFGLFGYLLALGLAVFSPAAWAARGALGMDKVVVFIACGVAAVPAWMALDRGNSVGFVVPIALAFLVALRRQRWGIAAAMVILAALVKPQFVLLAVVLFAARQWRQGGIAVTAAAALNLAAYALWPRDFPNTIEQSLGSTLDAGAFQRLAFGLNVSFGRAVLVIPDSIAALRHGGTIPDGFLLGVRSLAGYGVLIVVAICLLVLGRRVSPVMAGIAMLATASLFPPLSQPYYLVFALPVAALIVHDPDGPPATGIFDRLESSGGRRRVMGISITVAAALSLAQIALPSPSVRVPIVGQLGLPGVVVTTAPLVISSASNVPIFWLIAVAAVIVSYARKPAFPMTETALCDSVR